jgi:hypothetical protein
MFLLLFLLMLGVKQILPNADDSLKNGFSRQVGTFDGQLWVLVDKIFKS